MDTGLMLAVIGLVVAGLSSVLGIWMERDPTRPPRWAILLSVLIVLATVVSLFQSAADAAESARMEEDMARMLQSLDRLSAESPELSQFLSKEMEAQSRSNPDVIQKVAARVTAEGGDAGAMLSRHLPASEMQGTGVKAQPGAAPATSSAALEKAQSELAAAQKKLAEVEAVRAELEAAKKKEAESKTQIEDLTDKLEALEKANEKLKAAPKAGGSRWEKG